MLALSGKHYANVRQFIMSNIMGKQIPKSKSEILVLYKELLKFANIDDSEKCLAETLDFLSIWVSELSFEKN